MDVSSSSSVLCVTIPQPYKLDPSGFLAEALGSPQKEDKIMFDDGIQEPETSGTSEDSAPYVRISVQIDINRQCIMGIAARLISVIVALPIIDSTIIPLFPL